MAEKKLYLIDAYALIFRAYYSLGKNFLYNSKGFNTTAVMGFTRTLHNLIEKEKPTHIAVVFDYKADTFRNEEFAYYKANRDETPEDIRLSEPIIRDIIKAYNIPVLEVKGFEADDVIGTLAKQKAREGFNVYMVTPDKDFAQLVQDNIFIYKPGRQGKPDEILGVPEVLEKWKVERTEQIIDVLGLWGDSVDNIPGVPGIGEKTAQKLLAKYDSIEGILAHTQELKGKQKENVEAYAQQARDSKYLATIITNVPIKCSDRDLLIDPMNKEKLAEIFSELELRRLGSQILGDAFNVNTSTKPSNGQMDMFTNNTATGATDEVVAEETGKTIENTEHNYHFVDSTSEREQLVEQLLKQSQVAFDTETTGLNDLATELVGMSFSWQAGEGYYVPISEDQDIAREQVAIFKGFFESNSIEKIAQNAKFDINVLSLYGIEVSEPIFDTMLAHYVLEPDKRHGMDYLAETYLGYTPVSIESLIGKKGKNQGSMRDVPPEKLTEYAAEDADITWQLYQVLEPLVKKHKHLHKVFDDIEKPLLPILSGMEKTGVALDVDFLNTYSEQLNEEILKVRDTIFTACGTEFNLDSPKQLGEVLFGQMGIPYKGKRTKTGQYSTAEATLLGLAKEHEIVHHILDYRQIAKLKSTYVDALPLLINERTGRLHTTFQQAVAATGRLSSYNPNLQNIPIRTERGRKVRKAFIPTSNNHVILAADYSQIELRLVAHLSEDETMIEAFNQGIDIHTLTASKVFGVPEDEVTREMRGNAKTVNFGIIYGVSAFGLSQQTDLSRSESKEIIDNYFKTYPQLKQYMDENIDDARAQGFVETIMGRRRYLPDINSRNRTVRGHAERNAINSPVQGSAADLVKIAMLRVHDRMEKEQLSSVMTLQVHDELLFDVEKSELETMKALVIEEMEAAIPNLKVRMIAETGTGNNWLEAH